MSACQSHAAVLYRNYRIAKLFSQPTVSPFTYSFCKPAIEKLRPGHRGYQMQMGQKMRFQRKSICVCQHG